MQQHLMQMKPMMAAYYPNNVTTDHIQQYLDENKSLILKIVDSQNSGKLSECAHRNQERLQRNLVYLAAIADSQPQPPSMHAQFSSGSVMHPGAHYMQHQQYQPMTPQSLVAARSSMVYSQQQFSALQQQQALHGQLAMSSGGSSGLHMLRSEGSPAGGCRSLGAAGFPNFGRSSSEEGLHLRGMAGGSKQDLGNSGSAEGRGGSSGKPDGGETLYLKGSNDGN